MNTQPSPCEEFEVAALRRARGALDGDVAARLEAHLRSCASCHGFAAAAAATEAALRGRIRSAAGGRDWDRVRAGFRARRRTDRNRKLGGLAAFALMVAIGWWAGGWVVGAIFTVYFAALVVFLYGRFVLPEQRRAREVGAIDTEMLAFYRSDLDKEIKGLRDGRPLVIVFAFLFAANTLLMVGHVVKDLLLGKGFPSLESYLVTCVTFALIGGAMWLRGRFVLPRLERERRELGA